MAKNNYRNITATGLLGFILFISACSGGQDSSPLQLTDYPEYGSDSVKLFLSKCGACHGAPLPKVHDARQWLAVVERMQMRMTSKAMPGLTKEEMKIIVEYLQKNARK